MCFWLKAELKARLSSWASLQLFDSCLPTCSPCLHFRTRHAVHSPTLSLARRHPSHAHRRDPYPEEVTVSFQESTKISAEHLCVRVLFTCIDSQTCPESFKLSRHVRKRLFTSQTVDATRCSLEMNADLAKPSRTRRWSVLLAYSNLSQSGVACISFAWSAARGPFLLIAARIWTFSAFVLNRERACAVAPAFRRGYKDWRHSWCTHSFFTEEVRQTCCWQIHVFTSVFNLHGDLSFVLNHTCAKKVCTNVLYCG